MSRGINKAILIGNLADGGRRTPADDEFIDDNIPF